MLEKVTEDAPGVPAQGSVAVHSLQHDADVPLLCPIDDRVEPKQVRDVGQRLQGRRSDACALLTSTFNWFSEGFESADLRAAKALLDELT